MRGGDVYMNYVYSIKNLINKKEYIGITNNIMRRRKRHFSDLRCQRHDNKHLQKAFNKYGEENFVFTVLLEKDCKREEILELEKYYIQKLDTYNNGYNLNAGGLENNGFHSKISAQDALSILCILNQYTNSGNVLSEFFQCTRTTISRIKRGESHLESFLEFQNTDESEKIKIATNFINSNNLNRDVNKRNRKGKKLTEEKSHFILSVNKFDSRKLKQLSEVLNCSRTTINSLIKGDTYKDYLYSFKCLNEEQQKQIYDNNKYLLEERNSNKKLSNKEVLEILLLKEKVEMQNKELSSLYGVSPPSIKRIVDGEVYKYFHDEFSAISENEKEIMWRKIIGRHLKMMTFGKSNLQYTTIESILNEKELNITEISNKYNLNRKTIKNIKEGKSYTTAFNIYNINLNFASSYSDVS